MRASHVPALALIGGAALLPWAPGAGAAPPDDTGNCVSWFTTTLSEDRLAGVVISGGARDPELAPFGRVAVRAQAAADLGDCPFDPAMP